MTNIEADDDVQLIVDGLYESANALRKQLGDRDADGCVFSQGVTAFYAMVLATVPKEEDRRTMTDTALTWAKAMVQQREEAGAGGAYADSIVLRADGTREP